MVKQTFCPRLWDEVFISKDGNVFSCCYEKPRIIGNIYREKLQTIVDLAITYNHEINNPLFSLSGYLEILKRGETDTKKLENIDKALAMIERIAEVTKKIEETTSLEYIDYPGGLKMLNIAQKDDV